MMMPVEPFGYSKGERVLRVKYRAVEVMCQNGVGPSVMEPGFLTEWK